MYNNNWYTASRLDVRFFYQRSSSLIMQSGTNELCVKTVWPRAITRHRVTRRTSPPPPFVSPAAVRRKCVYIYLPEETRKNTQIWDLGI